MSDFMKAKHYIGHTSGMVGPINWNKKKVHRLDSGLTMWSRLLTSPMTLTLDFSNQIAK